MSSFNEKYNIPVTAVATTTEAKAMFVEVKQAAPVTFHDQFKASSDMDPKERMLALGKLYKEIQSKEGKALIAGLHAVWSKLYDLKQDIQKEQEVLLAQYPELMMLVMEL
jgi:hypothetical protein